VEARIKRFFGETLPWESQARQYPKVGPPGISYFRGVFSNETGHYADCLLYRDKHGKLRGILNHYPHTVPFEQQGNVNIWVEPRFQGKGIATKLLAEAEKRWQVNFDQQKYTSSGEQFIIKYLNKKKR
jgi:GNAT superfamily N-acetyltransferase